MKKEIYIVILISFMVLQGCKETVEVKKTEESIDRHTTSEYYSFYSPQEWKVEESDEAHIDYILSSPDNRESVIISSIPDMGHHGSVFISSDIEFMKKNGFELITKEELDLSREDVEGTMIRYKGSTTGKTKKRYYESHIFTKGYEGILMGVNYPTYQDKSDELEEFLSTFTPFPEE